MFCGLGEEERTKIWKKKKEQKKEQKKEKKGKKKKQTSSRPKVGWLGWKGILRHTALWNIFCRT